MSLHVAETARNSNDTCDIITTMNQVFSGVVALYEAKYSDVTACLYECQLRAECVTAQWRSSGVCNVYDVSPRDASVTLVSDTTAQLYEFLCEGMNVTNNRSVAY